MSILDPHSIAVIGASAQEGKVGHDILKNLLKQGYAGTVYPVNPKGGEILSKTVCTSINDLPTVPDLAVIVIPAPAVPQALAECGEKGIKNVVVINKPDIISVCHGKACVHAPGRAQICFCFMNFDGRILFLYRFMCAIGSIIYNDDF